MTGSSNRDHAKRHAKKAKKEIDPGFRRSEEDGRYDAKLENVVDPNKLKAELKGFRSRERR